MPTTDLNPDSTQDGDITRTQTNTETIPDAS